MIYLVAAYGVFWLTAFLVIVRINLREKQLEREIKALWAFLDDENG